MPGKILATLVVSLVGAILGIVSKIATGLISKKVQKKPPSSIYRDSPGRKNKQNITSTIEAIPTVYGYIRVGINRVFVAQKFAYAGEETITSSSGGTVVEQSSATRGEYLFLTGAVSVGEVEDIQSVYINGVNIASSKFSSGYKNNVSFTWSYSEPSPVTLVSSQVLWHTGWNPPGGGWQFQAGAQNFFDGSIWKKVITTRRTPDRYYLYRIYNGRTNLIRSFAGGVNKILLRNLLIAPNVTYYLDYQPDNAPRRRVGNAVVSLTKDNVDFNQSVNNNLTIVQDSYLASAYIQFEEKRGTPNQTASSQFLANGVPGYNSGFRGLNVALIYLRLLLRTKGRSAEKAPLALQIPEVEVDILGKKIHIYNANGEITSTEYSANPVWCLLDYLLNIPNKYYGAEIKAENVNWLAAVAAAAYCDQLITASDGVSQIKRFVCNGLVNNGSPIADNLNRLFSCFNGNLTQDLGQWLITIDKSESPTYTFNSSNMVGKLAISQSDWRNVTNTVQVQFVNKNTNWETDLLEITNNAFVQQDNNRKNVSELDLPFTNDYEHAYYLGLLNLKQSRVETQASFEFQSHWEALEVAPGDVVTINRPELGIENQLVRVREIAPDNENGLLQFTCVMYDSDVYNNLNIDPFANNPPPSLPSAFDIEPPSNVQVRQSFGQDANGNYITQTEFTWDLSPSVNVSRYVLELRSVGISEFLKYGETLTGSVTVNDLPPAVYDLRLKAISSLGQESEYYEEEVQVFAPSERPPNITDFQIKGSVKEFVLNWNIEPQVANNGFYILRHSPLLTGAAWNDIPTFEILIPGSQTSTTVSQIDGTYLIKAVNSAGLTSEQPAILTIDSPYDSEYALVNTIIESPTFNGTIENNSLIVQNNNLTLNYNLVWSDIFVSTQTWSDIFNSSQTWSDIFGENNKTLGAYLFVNRLVLDGVYKILLQKNVLGTLTANQGTAWIDVYKVNQTWLDITEPDESWTDVFGALPEKTVNINLLFRFTKDPGLTNWSEWQLLTKNEVTCRAAEFRLEVISEKPSVNVLINTLGLQVYMKNRVDQKQTQLTAPNQILTFKKAFFEIPETVTLTINNPVQGDYTTFSNLTKTGFIGNCYNNLNQSVNRTVTVTTYGTGELLT